jgi:hypothetical protein
METAGQIVEYVTRAGLAVMLLILIVGGSRGWWVFGREFKTVEAQRDDWKRQAEELLTLLVQQELDDASKTKGR